MKNQNNISFILKKFSLQTIMATVKSHPHMDCPIMM